jgi:hypothetical protein
MTEDLRLLIQNLESGFFRYAHITGALEFYMMMLEMPELQKRLTDSEIEWKQIHRFMNIDGQMITWYPELPVATILSAKLSLLGFLHGVTLSRIVGDLDYYITSVLKNHFGHTEFSGSAWNVFVKKTGIKLLKCKNGEIAFTLLQERHKIEHNQAHIDSKFLERMQKTDIKHAYRVGDSIQKSHLDILAAQQSILEFAQDVDLELSKILSP